MASVTYTSLGAAARGLLGEASAIATNCGTQFAVCGGWSSVLRNSTHVSHPGTRDVDLLFYEGATIDSLKDVMSAFLDRGYLPSAKHQFQALRTLRVGQREYVFNVDVLHPHEGDVRGDMFVDQLSLPIPHEDFESSHFVMKSIALPNAGFVFDGFVEEEEVEVMMPDGTVVTQVVPVIDEVGLLVTKSKSCMSQKRPRDIFDIYLAIAYPRSQERFTVQLRRLRDRHEDVFATLKCIGQGVELWEHKFGAPAVFSESGVSFVVAAEAIRRFIEQLGFCSRPRNDNSPGSM